MMKIVSQPLKMVHFRLIDAIALHGQLSRAAEDIAITQPAASRMLSEIEALLGARLFERRSKGMELTLIGEAVARRARLMMQEMHDISREIAELKSGNAGEVHIGAVTGAAVGYLVTAIVRFRTLMPSVVVHIDVAPSHVLIPQLLEREFDFVLGRVPHGIDPQLFVSTASRLERIGFVAHRSHPLVGRAQVTAQMLAEWQWVMQPAGTPIREALQRSFLEAQADMPDTIINTTSLMMVVALLARTDTIAPMAVEVADLLAGDGIQSDIVPLDLAQHMSVAPYSLLTLRHRALSPAAARMRDIVEALMREAA